MHEGAALPTALRLTIKPIGTKPSCGTRGPQLARNSSLTKLGVWTMLTADQRVERRGWQVAQRLRGRYFENCSCDIAIEDFAPPLNPGGEMSRLTGMFHTGKNGHSAPFSWAA
jgi:hypothetical protein